jgi:transketolase
VLKSINYLGGMGESISRTFWDLNTLAPWKWLQLKIHLGESGTPAQLMTKYGLDKNAIIGKVKHVIKRK